MYCSCHPEPNEMESRDLRTEYLRRSLDSLTLSRDDKSFLLSAGLVQLIRLAEEDIADDEQENQRAHGDVFVL